MRILSRDYNLIFKHPFVLASGMRMQTPSVIVILKQGTIAGYGEATLPPYLPETQASVSAFISKIKLDDITTISEFKRAVMEIQRHDANYFAKAALDIALHDLWAKLNNNTLSDWLNIQGTVPPCTHTIGMDTPEVIKQKVLEANDFKMLKVKLGGANDKQIILTIRSCTDKPICIDANGGWKTKEEALAMIEWLNNYNVLFIEQPLPKQQWDDTRWLKGKSPLPLIADEDFQTIQDLENVSNCYDGINIKLMKCGGISPALKIIKLAKKKNLKILIGCMSESSCGVAAAASIQCMADWVDLDGPLLIRNDPFTGVSYVDGYIQLSSEPGLGVHLIG
jgi:L-alanine-DL-glutamate epimerase-like enolase superfamily enzyme